MDGELKKKLALMGGESPLSIYPAAVILREAIGGKEVIPDLVISYNAEASLSTLQAKYPHPGRIFIGHGILVTDLLSVIDLPKQDQPPVTVEPAPVKSTREQFIYNLELFADQFVKSNRDKGVIRGIIRRIKV